MATFVTKYLRVAGGVAELEQPLRATGWFSERTAWVGRLTPLRRFVRTETGGAAVLAALVWANVGSSYPEVWKTPVALTFGDHGIRLSLREWVNSGLMTFFFLTVLVVNELVALALIAALYSHDLDLTALAWGATFVAMIGALGALGVRSSIPCVLLAVAAWVALHESGVEPVVLGLALGLLVGAHPVGRPALHHAAERFRRFREQPTPKLERSARHGL